MTHPEKTALVLGALGGIGRGIALDLAQRGYRIAAPYFDWPERLPEVSNALTVAGTVPLLIPTDLRDAVAVADMMSTIMTRFGRLDVLINNIERGGWPTVHGPYTQSQWDLEMATTLKAKQWVFHEALPHLKESGNGAVVVLSSIAAMVGRTGPAAAVFNDGYAAANRGVGMLTETWARQGAPEVRVNEVMLGLVAGRHGPGTRGWETLSESQRSALITRTPLGRTGTVEDVVRAVRFFIEDAPFATGSVMRIDGGYVIGGETVPDIPEGILGEDER